MGTRADFYVGRGELAEWIGSIAWDGYPEGIDKSVFSAASESEFRANVTKFFENDRKDVTLPEQGWPWPWEDSQTTDYAYAFDGGKVWASCFGHAWFDPSKKQSARDELEPDEKVAVFPNMTERMNVTMGKRSGTITIVGGKVVE